MFRPGVPTGWKEGEEGANSRRVLFWAIWRGIAEATDAPSA
jgi:hypothetical protein